MTGPLASLKILDFSTLLPGPFASLLLADLGAEVLRIESPTRPDLLRLLPPRVQGASAAHAWVNRNKRSLALDLKQPTARAVVHDLLREYDILIEQFRPGVMERLGLDYVTLKAINPRLIYVSISGYGQTGPYRERAGHDINYLAISGLAACTGRRDSGPVPPGVPIADLAGGSLHGVVGLLAAVIQRQLRGEGQQVDVSMTDCAFSLHALGGAAALAGGVEPGLENQPLNGGSFYDYYRTRDGRWLAVGCLEPQFLQAFCSALGRPQLAARGLSQKAEDQQALKGEFASEIERRSLAECQALFADLDACVEPVLSFSEALEHPQLAARQLVTEVPGPSGPLRQLACPLKFSAGLPAPRHSGATVGEHGEQVLRELGYDEARIRGLRDSGVLGGARM
ncbi:MAG TPA: CaiB/BaiF CoA-transferase family protein [Pseudomonas sp.]|nr:CaiB/BaiF CoA-transferase family protein [Pseudomonas sp.]